MRKLPAYPLFVKDPYFSVWFADDILNESNTVFWHGEEKPLYGTVIADGKEYAFLGKNPGAIPLKQNFLDITAFATVYGFSCDDFELTVEFVSPLPPDNLEIASCPVCYLKYKLLPRHPLKNIKISLTAEERLCYNTCYQEGRREDIRGGVMRFDGFESVFFGLLRQLPLSHSSDEFGADWGYYYLAGQEGEYFEQKGMKYIRASDSFENIAREQSGKILIAFDDLASIFYYGDFLKGYYFRSGKTISDALRESYANAEAIFAECQRFDEKLQNDARRYGEEYLLLLYASLRQSMAAHKIVEDRKGRTLFLSKECNSDGCIATADVSYPSAPLYLLYAPELVNGMLYPIFDFARMDAWEYDFAPHDAGIYPYCLGQLYGALNQNNKYNSEIYMKDWHKPESFPLYYLYPKNSNLYSLEKQMPVEECGNMLILTAAANLAGGNDTILSENFDLLKKWADYLGQNGLLPENQLCTDDFAGHLEKNSNLSLKANFGIAAFAAICERLGKKEEAKKYMEKARRHAEKWRALCFTGEKSTGISVGENDENTYGLKYNLVFDKLFHTNLYPDELFERETDRYLAERKKFGTPLDSRASYTKSDWLVWVAALCEDEKKTEQLIAPIIRFLKETPDRVPFADWYDAETGKNQLFRNRSVQGGIFILLLLASGKLRLPDGLCK